MVRRCPKCNCPIFDGEEMCPDCLTPIKRKKNLRRQSKLKNYMIMQKFRQEVVNMQQAMIYMLASTRKIRQSPLQLITPLKLEQVLL